MTVWMERCMYARIHTRLGCEVSIRYKHEKELPVTFVGSLIISVNPN